MRVGAFAHRAAHVWRRARHVGRSIDRAIHNGAYLYSAIRPGLLAAGVDTRSVDRTLSKNYGHYNKMQESLSDGIQVVDGIAANLRGGNFTYS